MTAQAYYNEHDPHAAEWLRNLIANGSIAPGEVDERDIRDVVPSELARFTQCHFFAGIGVWSYALRRAGWPDDRRVWTGSCPCQPFSAAGKGGGFDDERHLWPSFFHLIEQCRPDTIFGEQVASKDGLAWLDLVYSDLEAARYAVGAFDLCAAGVGAPHIRQRLFFVADSVGPRGRRDARAIFGAQGASSREWGDDRRLADQPFVDGSNGVMADSAEPRRNGRSQRPTGTDDGATQEPRRLRDIGILADSESLRLLGRQNDGDSGRRERTLGQGREAGELGDADKPGLERRGVQGSERPGERTARAPGAIDRPGPTNGLWGNSDWLFCADGKWRPVEPGSFPLAHGAAFRVGSCSAFEGKSRAKMLKGYGNAINAEVAAEFIRAYLEVTKVDIAPFELIDSVALRIVAGLAEMGRSDDDSAPRG